MTTQAIEKAQTPITTIADYLGKRKDQIAMVMAAGMDIERLTKVAIAAISRNPYLLQCTPESIYSSIHTSVQLGLEPGSPFGEAYLVPYKNNKIGKWEAQFIPGYQGLAKLARNSGIVKKLYARVARENDTIVLKQGLDEDLQHTPKLDGPRGKPVLVYAVAHLEDGSTQFEWMTVEEVDAIKARSKSKDNGPWVTDWEEMAKKTVFKRLAKWLPKSTTKEGTAFALAVGEDNADTRFDIDVTAAAKPDAPALPDAGARVMERIAKPAQAVTVEAPPHDPETGEVTQAATPTMPETVSFEARRVMAYLDKGRVDEAAAALDKAIEGRHLEAGEEEALTARVGAAR